MAFLFSISFSSEFMNVYNRWLIKDLQNVIIERYINLIILLNKIIDSFHILIIYL